MQNSLKTVAHQIAVPETMFQALHVVRKKKKYLMFTALLVGLYGEVTVIYVHPGVEFPSTEMNEIYVF